MYKVDVFQCQVSQARVHSTVIPLAYLQPPACEPQVNGGTCLHGRRANDNAMEAFCLEREFYSTVQGRQTFSLGLAYEEHHPLTDASVFCGSGADPVLGSTNPRDSTESQRNPHFLLLVYSSYKRGVRLA